MYVSVCVLCVCVHVCVHVLGAVHKVRHVQGGGGGLSQRDDAYIKYTISMG